MKPYLISLACLLGCGLFAKADEPRPLFDCLHWRLPRLGLEWDSRKCWGPNDYDPKSPPRAMPNCKGAVDDYCRKTTPIVTANPRGCVDDYCPKTCPISIGKVTEPWYSLGPPCPPSGGPCQNRPPKQH